MNDLKVPELPSSLHAACKVYIKELFGHIQFFKDLVTIQNQLNEESLKKAKNRFHLIKGGAGFFKLEELQNIGDQGEAICLNKDLPTVDNYIKTILPLIENWADKLKDHYDLAI
jgi:hypothetical protein